MSSFSRTRAGRDIGAGVLAIVAKIRIIHETTARGLCAWSAAPKTGETVRLIEGANGLGDVSQFLIDGHGHVAEPDNHADDSDGENQREFGRDDETRFVLDQLTQRVRDLSSS